MPEQLIRVSLAFRKMRDADLLAFVIAIVARMTGNANFLKPAVDIAVLSAAAESLSAAITEALDGGRRAISERNRQRHAVIALLRQLAIYVESASSGNPAAFASSGFTVAATSRVPTQPL